MSITNYKKIKEAMNDSNVGQKLAFKGWINKIRKHKEWVFLSLRDNSGEIQCVLPSNEKSIKLTQESSLELIGELIKENRAPGGYELRADDLNIINISELFPIGKDVSTEFLNDQRHLWNRSKKMSTIMKVRADIVRIARNWFFENDWYETFPPIINRSACEGGATLFEINYFNEKAFLSQSAQLYLESLIYSLDSVWSLTPSFRAEKSKTPRHLAEYWHLEAEKAWTTFDEILNIEEKLISHIVKNIISERSEELIYLGRDPEHLSEICPPFERISYSEVIKFLNNKGRNLSKYSDIGSEEERELTKDLKKPIFIYGCPKLIKPFYTKVNPVDENMVLSADMLAPEGYGEISTGGQREENLDLIVKRIREDGFKPEDYSWYLDLRKYGSVPHSGFGFGVERIVRWICKLDHIRDTIPYPRTMTRSYP